MKTPEQILAIFRQGAERSKNGFDIARAKSDPDLLAFNIGQGFKAYLMQGLIGWRCRFISPFNVFREGIDFVRYGLSIWEGLNGNISTRNVHLPIWKASIIAFLINENPFAIDQKDLVADSLLDAILAGGLRDKWDEVSWTVGLDQLRKIKGASLAVESYMTYHHLLHLSNNSDAKGAVEKAISLFEKRKNNSFYCGGEQTEGGGKDNAITVDYPLAAIMKKKGYKGESIHSWQWE